MKHSYIILFIVFSGFVNTGSSCKLSLNGASIPPEISSVTVNYFPNQSSFVATSLSQTFTETLIDKFNRESNLTVKDRDGDWEFGGAITNYISSAIAPTGDETTALNRLTITVKVEFTNHKNEDQNWSQSFSRFADYESTQTLSTVENDLIAEITEQLADDIFLKVAGNW